jgi:hypothetical protein
MFVLDKAYIILDACILFLNSILGTSWYQYAYNVFITQIPITARQNRIIDEDIYNARILTT